MAARPVAAALRQVTELRCVVQKLVARRPGQRFVCDVRTVVAAAERAAEAPVLTLEETKAYVYAS